MGSVLLLSGIISSAVKSYRATLAYIQQLPVLRNATFPSPSWPRLVNSKHLTHCEKKKNAKRKTHTYTKKPKKQNKKRTFNLNVQEAWEIFFYITERSIA